MTSPARRPSQAKPQPVVDPGPGGLVTIAADLDPVVADMLGGRLAVGPVGTLLGETRGTYALRTALCWALSLEAGQ